MHISLAIAGVLGIGAPCAVAACTIATSIHRRGLDGALAIAAARIMATSRALHAARREYRAVLPRYERAALRDVRQAEPARRKPTPAAPVSTYPKLIERIFTPQKGAA